MTTTDDEILLKQCLNVIIDQINQYIENGALRNEEQQRELLQPQSNRLVDISQKPDSLMNDTSDDARANGSLDSVTRIIEETLEQDLPNLSKKSQRFLLDFFHTYHYKPKQKKFHPPLNLDDLNPLIHDLNGLLKSVTAFADAFRGRLLPVKTFLETYPEWKDKSGLWQTTLLYSAAHHDRLDIIQYLIEEAHCSINAQNQRQENDITEMTSSTALHHSCLLGHLILVKYLVEHGANYFIRNQMGQTPIMAGKHHANIQEYFQDYLIIKYSIDAPLSLPDCTFSDDSKRPTADGWWEYKPIRDSQWYKFPQIGAAKLREALLPSKEFQEQIYLSLRKNFLYYISMVDFFRSGNYADDPEGKVAWIRYRGSSVFSFDCHALWQIMLLKHPKTSALPDTTPTMKVETIPEMSDKTFQPQLNTWYRCDMKTNQLLEDAINMRRKIITIHINSIGENLSINFDTFTLTNNDQTITGYLRWIPKLISNTERKKNKIVEIDNYQPMTNLEPIPLTTKHLRDVVIKGTADQEENIVDDDDVDDDGSDNAEMTDMKDIDDVDDGDDEHQSNEERTDDSQDVLAESEIVADPSVEAFFHPTVGQLQQPTLVERSNADENKQFIDVMMAKIRSVNQKLKDEFQNERRQIELRAQSNQESHPQTEKQLKQALERLEQMQQQVDKHNNREQAVKSVMKQIKTINYINVEPFVIENFLYRNLADLIDHLNEIQELDELIKGKIPKVIIREQNSTYCISITGLQCHHDEFKIVLRRIRTLSNLTRSSQDYYQRKLRRIIKGIHQSLIITNIPSLLDWKCYAKIIRKLMQNEMETYVKNFDDYIIKQAKDIVSQCIANARFKSWDSMKEKTNEYLKNHSFSDEIEALKHKAFDEFVNQQVVIRPPGSQSDLSAASLQVMNEFINRVKTEFKNNRKFIGISKDQSHHTAYLLQRIMLYYRSCLLKLPLYQSSKYLLDKIEKNTVVTIATSTGSGKSTLLPALLIAEGYNRVWVTQPRRLPCTAICNRVNETMTNIKDRFPLAGWSVSGAERNPDAQILYLTDGLLKERLLFDSNFIENEISDDKRFVLFVDEVHERSINIDLCLALIARLLTEQPLLRSKLKVIISSATLDKSVPNLFRQISQLKFDQYQMPFSQTLHKVEKIYRPKENILDVVQELCRKRQRHDQILCFVSSVTDVYQYCRLLDKISHSTVIAHPLVQSQSANEQQRCIEHGTIFFSTTVAETSLTFPSLKYVVDTGMINVPIYDPKAKQTTLKEVPASESTIKQRLGRLGRTKPGEYHALYDSKMERRTYHKPLVCQSNLIDVEFSLRRSSLDNGLSHLSKFLPDPPESALIEAAVEELKRLEILSSSKRLSKTGRAIAQLPDFGTLPMAKAVLSALMENKCGRDLVVLSAILSVLNTSLFLKSVPLEMISKDGDFMTLLTVINTLLSEREKIGIRKFKLDLFCQTRGKLLSQQHILNRAVKRYDALQKSFKQLPVYIKKAQISSGDWKAIAKSLLKGYGDNIYVSMKELYGRNHRFVRYHSNKEEYAVMDHHSTLSRSKDLPPIPIVLARDIRYSSSVRANAVLSFVGRLESSWIQMHIERRMKINTLEGYELNTGGLLNNMKSLYSDVQMQANQDVLTLQGPSGSVIDVERTLIRKLVRTQHFPLTNDVPTTKPDDHKRMNRNLKSVTKMTKIFKPMIWRWENEGQVKVTITTGVSAATCDVNIEGRDSQYHSVKDEIESFKNWLRESAVIRHPDAIVPPRIIKQPMRKSCLDIEERISHVTDSKRTTIDLWNGLRGAKATRETRMEVIAWIVVCKFKCHVEGGFVRDWIIGHYQARPAGNPSTWITYRTNIAGDQVPELNKELVPTDLDCHLPVHEYFDLDKFLDFLHKYQIEYSYVREGWRYIFLLDEHANTGPFTMDLIEPHVALTHDRIDFDVNNLSLEKDYTKELAMRVDTRPKPYSIDLEAIVDNIKHKRFQLLRPLDHGINIRIQKMISRGWTKTGEDLNFIPDPPPRCEVIVVPVPQTADIYQSVVQQLQKKINNQVKVHSIVQIKNPSLEDAYIAIRQLIAKECVGGIPQERLLFHGTSGTSIDGILNDGFDDRYWNSGKWGHGAYFAENPAVSHVFAQPDANDQTRVMFYNKVTLGKQQTLQNTDGNLKAAPKGFHSVHGIPPGTTDRDEFIVYRYAQALPYLKITYKA